MPFRPPTYEELFLRYKREMEALGFTHWAEGSTVGAIGKTLAAYLGDLWNTLSFLDEQTNPSSATGVYLDRLGEMFGVTRLNAQYASSVGRGPAVKFTNTGGTSASVPAGTRIWNPDQPDIAFFTTESLNLAAGGEGYVHVVAGVVGEEHNVGVGTLTNHNAGMAQLRVTNVRPVGGGSGVESDESYRFRISQALQARHGATELSIRQALLKLPGVRDVIIRVGARGNGSLDVLVIPIDRYLSEDLRQACEVEVAQTVAAGISWRVQGPVTRRVDVRVQLRLTAGTTLSEVRTLVDAAVRSYIDNLRVNDGVGNSDLIYNELISRIQDASPEVVDSAVQLFLDGIPALQTNLIPNPGERLISGSVTIS